MTFKCLCLTTTIKLVFLFCCYIGRDLWYFSIACIYIYRILDGCEEIWILCSFTREHKSISSRNRLMFCLLYGLTQSDKNTRKDDV